MTDKAARDELVSDFDAAMQMVAEAKAEADAATVAILEFDDEHPEVMPEFHREMGERKKAMRGSSGTVQSAEGHAELAAAKGKGG